MEAIETYLSSLPDWQRTNLELFRKLLHEVDPTIVEDFKWNVPVFLVNKKLYFAMSAFKAHTKFNFIGNGAVISDPDQLFNNGFDSKKARGIDLREDETIDEAKLKALIKTSIEHNN
jgi:hypothetical protein